MKKSVRIPALLSLALAVFMIISAFSSVAHAQEQPEERITLSPAVLQPEFNGGQTATGKLTVINDGETNYTFLVYARPFSVEGEAYSANYTEVNERTEAYQWVQLQQTKYTLDPGQQVEVPYTVRVPAGAAGGGHYAVIFAETQPPASNTTQVARKKRVGALLYMTVSGDIRREGSLESWETTFWQTKKPVTSQLRLKNSGNVHYQADLKAHYKNIFGKNVFELNQQLLVLPGTTRRTPVEWNNAPVFGIFKAGGTVEFLGKTEILPTKYILLMPKYVPIIFIALAAVVLLFVIKKRKTKKRTRLSGSRRR